MRTLVLGGVRSGKSRWAETAIADGLIAGSAVSYIATASPARHDAAWEQRIAAHRQRRPSGWQTVETADVATRLRADTATASLVDDLGNWLTALLDHRGWDTGSVDAEVADLVDAVRGFQPPLVLVSPEVGLSVVPATASARRFADELGTLNQRLADCCERVVLMVAGQPVWIKPGPC